jgi:hypothetical protein
MTRRAPATVAAATAVLTLATGGLALGAWQKAGTGSGASQAATLAAPGKPAGTPTGLSVALSWTGSLTPTGGAASYAVERALFGGSTWTQVCTASHNPGTATSCTDTTPSGGDYQYRVISVLATSWRSTSPVSNAVTAVAATAAPSAPDLLPADDSGVSSSDDITNLATPRFTGTATAGSFVRLYRAGVEIGSQQLGVGATAWTITPTAALAEGSSVAMTATAQGTGATVSAASPSLAVTFDRTAPAVTAFRLSASGSTSGIVSNGTVEKGDTFSITYSPDLAPSTLCEAWTSAPYSQSGNNNVTVTLKGATALDDIQVVATNCSTFRLGAVSTNASYHTADQPFGANGSGNDSSFAYANSVLTFTLGNGTARGSGVAAVAPSYTPVAGITDIAGNALPTTTFTGTSSRF